MILWGTAAILDSNYSEGIVAFKRLMQHDPSEPLGPFGLWVCASRSGQQILDREAFAVLRTYSPNGPEVERIVTHMHFYPAIQQHLPAP